MSDQERTVLVEGNTIHYRNLNVSRDVFGEPEVLVVKNAKSFSQENATGDFGGSYLIEDVCAAAKESAADFKKMFKEK